METFEQFMARHQVKFVEDRTYTSDTFWGYDSSCDEILIFNMNGTRDEEKIRKYKYSAWLQYRL